MQKPPVLVMILLSFLLPTAALHGATPDDAPRPVPLTRPEMKQLLEDVKVRIPRIPMPELSDADRKKLGREADSYESAIRYAYLPWVDAARRSQTRSGSHSSRTRDQDPNNALDYAFKTQLFWIVSRVNNCQYCIGHQESKLLSAGLTEEQIGALDGDWSNHTPAEQTAFNYARTLSYEPHTIDDSDIASLRQYYTDLQILEMTMSIARNNVSNRWKEAIGVPQRADEGGYSRSEDPNQGPSGSYLTPTPVALRSVVTKVAPVVFDQKGSPTRATRSDRPAVGPWSEVEQGLAAARSRQPRLPLVEESTAREVLGVAAPAGTLPTWMLLLANFPKEGVEQVQMVRSADEEGTLSPLLKAQLAWIIARQDRAWYATGQAYHLLREAGANEEQIAALDGDWKQFSPQEQALFTVAKQLAASPVVLTDRDVRQALESAGPRDVVETVNYTTSRAYFNRVTEAAGLPLEE